MGDFIRRHHHIHIGMAVAIEDGLIVPVVKFADQKSLAQIAAESKELAGKAKNKKLQPAEFTGNTFTISNLGMMDIDEFTAIINPPDSCIMAVGRIKEEVVKKGDGFAVTNVMKVTLSCDHRSVDGAAGAAALRLEVGQQLAANGPHDEHAAYFCHQQRQRCGGQNSTTRQTACRAG